jgi:TM2 domain-containing membrane protein YozV
LLFVCLGIFGVHRFYMGKWGTALIYLFTCGFFLIGIIYDFWTLNDKISRENTREADYPAYR